MRVLLPVFLALTCAPAALSAQEVVQALPGTTDADRLAEQMRALASNPRDINALIAAADLSLSLGDLSGAASLYARAEKVSANDPRIKAGEGAILVRSERPGEALRYFTQAEAAGYDVRRFAADRGLAYDLIGQQERAQRDYRLALKTQPDDETVRRYALSLGIVGKREAALEQLDPLLRRQDRSAWRIRAFVLAMSGDQAGAERIATTMLPGGMAQGLQPFFQRLPSLPAADRAFAVHFGEVHATPERLADARLAPNLPYLAPEAPVALAAVQPAQQPRQNDRRRRGRDDRRGVAPAVALAANTRAAPSYQAATAALARVQPVPAETRGSAVTLASAAPTALAATPVAPMTVTAASPVTRAVPVMSAAMARPVAPSVPTSAPAAATRTPPVTAATALPSTASPAPGFVSATTVPPAVSPAATPGVATAATTTRPSVASAPATSAPVTAATTVPVQQAVTATPTPAAVATVAAEPASNFTAPPSRAEADSVLARIVAGLSIPAAELDVAAPVRPAPVAAAPAADTAARVIAEAKAKEERDAAAEKALAAKAAADKRAADRKAAADKKALAAKKLAEAEKLAEAKAAAEEKKAARANPERIWVQVAGGAYEGDLPKAYAAVKAKAPAVFGSRGGWSTPLRATNRVLTGPFKTEAEARTFVNQLAKAGVSAFSFTSDAGQAVTKLPAK